MKPQSKKKVFTIQWTMWYLFSVLETDPTSVRNVVHFFSYRDRLINPFKYCRYMVPFNTIYSIYLLSLCSASDKDEWYRRKYGILLYLPLKIFTQYLYQSFWYQYRSFVWTDICLGELYIYWTLPYRYQSFVEIGISWGKRYHRSLQYRYQGLLCRYRSFVGSFWPL